LVDNSVSLHEDYIPGLNKSIRKNTSGRALLNYHELSDVQIQSGGVYWTWKRIFDGSLAKEEGIWFHGRLIAGNCYQILICVLIFLSCVALLKKSTAYAESNEGGPQKWQLHVSIVVGGMAGLLAAFGIACVYLPSFVCTVLRFRYGVIPSLGNRSFRQYRFAGKGMV